MEGKFYTIEQVAEFLGLHHKTIRKFITEGKLNAGKVGKQWRISGHDLSVFMEKNNVTVRSEDIEKEEEGIGEFSTKDAPSAMGKNKINVSTVIDINEVNKEQYMRISNTLIAVMNCKDPSMGGSTINVKYYEKENRLRVMLWGGVNFIEEMLSTVSMLTEQSSI